MRCYWQILHIPYKDHITNKEVCAKIQQAIRPHEDLLTIIKRRKLKWNGPVSSSSGPAKTIFQGTAQKHQETDSLGVHQVLEGSGKHSKIDETGCEVICGAPTTLVVKG